MVRYIAEYIHPGTGRATLGTLNTLVREYANDRNALRFMPRHLNAGHFAPGQYRVSQWPVRGDAPVIGWLYKLV